MDQYDIQEHLRWNNDTMYNLAVFGSDQEQIFSFMEAMELSKYKVYYYEWRGCDRRYDRYDEDRTFYIRPKYNWSMFLRKRKPELKVLEDSLRLIHGIKLDFFGSQKLDFVDAALIILNPYEHPGSHVIKKMKKLSSQGIQMLMIFNYYKEKKNEKKEQVNNVTEESEKSEIEEINDLISHLNKELEQEMLILGTNIVFLDIVECLTDNKKTKKIVLTKSISELLKAKNTALKEGNIYQQNENQNHDENDIDIVFDFAKNNKKSKIVEIEENQENGNPVLQIHQPISSTQYSGQRNQYYYIATQKSGVQEEYKIYREIKILECNDPLNKPNDDSIQKVYPISKITIQRNNIIAIDKALLNQLIAIQLDFQLPKTPLKIELLKKNEKDTENSRTVKYPEMSIILRANGVIHENIAVFTTTCRNFLKKPYFQNSMKTDFDNNYFIVTNTPKLSFNNFKLANKFISEFMHIKKDEKITFEISPKIFYTVMSPLDNNQGCAKSPNMHNQLIVSVQNLLYSKNLKENEKIYHQFDSNSLDNSILVVDQKNLNGIVNINEVKESIIAGFKTVLEDEVGDYLFPFKNVKITILDIRLHSDSIHRGGGQMIPTARKALLNAIEKALPRLMVPIFQLKMILTKNEILEFREFLESENHLFIKSYEIEKDLEGLVVVQAYLEAIIGKKY